MYGWWREGVEGGSVFFVVRPSPDSGIECLGVSPGKSLLGGAYKSTERFPGYAYGV